MKEQASISNRGAIQFESPVAATGALFHALSRLILGSSFQQPGALAGNSRGLAITKHDPFTYDVAAVGVRHDEKRKVIALHLEILRTDGGKQLLKDHKRLSAIFGENVKLQQRRTVSPWARNRYRSEADSLIVGV